MFSIEQQVGFLEFFLFVAALAAVVYFYILFQGEENVEILPRERQILVCEYFGADRAVFSFTLPFGNNGRQEGIVLDAFPRVLLPEEQFCQGLVRARLERAEARRIDGYLEAFIVSVGQNGEFVLTLEFLPRDGYSMDEVIKGMVDISIDIYYSVVGRTAPKIKRTSLTVLLEEFHESAGKAVVG